MTGPANTIMLPSRWVYNLPATIEVCSLCLSFLSQVLLHFAERQQDQAAFARRRKPFFHCQFYSDGSPISSSSQEHCGTVDVEYYSSGNTMVIQFISDRTREELGFQVNFTAGMSNRTTVLLFRNSEDK